MKNFIIESIDRCGKDTLISGILNRFGYKNVLHRSKPVLLEFYKEESKDKDPLFLYQQSCFAQDMALLKIIDSDANFSGIIYNRSWLGEQVYSSLYRGYDGSYVFELEKIAGLDTLEQTRLILLTEDFAASKHFYSDGNSFDDSKRKDEQKLFLDAFNRSIIRDKRMVIVTNHVTGGFRSKKDILDEVLNG